MLDKINVERVLILPDKILTGKDEECDDLTTKPSLTDVAGLCPWEASSLSLNTVYTSYSLNASAHFDNGISIG